MEIYLHICPFFPFLHAFPSHFLLSSHAPPPHQPVTARREAEMPAGRRHLPLLLALLFVSFHLGAPSDDDPNKVAHDGLELFGLPRGLLPDNVVSYTGSRDGGPFSVELSGTCYIQFSDLAYYHKTVSGKISYGLLSDLSGIEVRKLFFWFPIVRVETGDGDGTILFDTGLISERHFISEFQDVRECKDSAFSFNAAW
ncbi:hypothetical protein Taro_023890 [Colocasia esculenta]|uniref:Uncharacterized protein n=1 Tax=Colocasia esculenta TaxID=4460 RepID=A0A843V9P1_COLES|nr:hypothetical protein [Colocasia esculenta]